MTAPAGGREVILMAAEWHALAGYVLAFIFPLWRYGKCKIKRIKFSFESAVHQAGTGFVIPAFLILMTSYYAPDAADLLSPHEMGIAGMIALIASGRELFIDGSESDEKPHRYS